MTKNKKTKSIREPLLTATADNSLVEMSNVQKDPRIKKQKLQEDQPEGILHNPSDKDDQWYVYPQEDIDKEQKGTNEAKAREKYAAISTNDKTLQPAKILYHQGAVIERQGISSNVDLLINQALLEHKNDCKELQDINKEDDPQLVFNDMVKEFSEQNFHKIEQTIKPYEYDPTHSEFLPQKIRDCIDRVDPREINGTFKNISMQFFCKFEFIKGIKKVVHSEANQQFDMEKDKHFLLVKTWQKVRFISRNQQRDFKENTGELSKNTHKKNKKSMIKIKSQNDDSYHTPNIHTQNSLDIKRRLKTNQKWEQDSIQSEKHNQNKVMYDEKQFVDDGNNAQEDYKFLHEQEIENDSFFYVKTIQIFNESINLIKEILVEMIPVANESTTIDPYDASTFLLYNKLFFFRRIFLEHKQEVNHDAECRLFSYNLRPTHIIQDKDNHMIEEEIEEFKDYKNDGSSQNVRIDELDDSESGNYEKDKVHKHLNNIIFSEEFGQHEHINDQYQRELEEYRIILEEKDETKENEYSQQNQDHHENHFVLFQEQCENEKEQKMLEKQIELEKKLLGEQYIMTQSYHCDMEIDDMEKFKIYSINELLDGTQDYFDELLAEYFEKHKNDEGMLDFGKIEQIFHIKNYNKQIQFVNFLLIEKDKITHLVINTWEKHDVVFKDPYFFDENHNNSQQLTQWVQILVKNIKLKSHDENDQIERIEQFYFVDQYNQIQLLFPLYDMKLEKMKIKDLIENEIEFEQKDPSLFKMIQRVTDISSDQDDSKIFQSFSYLKLILPGLGENVINQDTQIFYVQHGYHQYLMINSINPQDKKFGKTSSQETENGPKQEENQGKKLIFYTLKENDIFYHLCSHGHEMLSERGYKNIQENENQQKDQQAYIRRETVMIKRHENLEKEDKNFSNHQQLKNHPQIERMLRQSIKQKVKDRQKHQMIYDIKDKTINRDQLMNEEEIDDSQSDISHIRQHQVYLDNPSDKNKDEQNKKVFIKTHEDDDINYDIILLISQIVGDIYQFVFVIEHKQDDNNNYVIKNKTYFFLQKTKAQMETIYEKDNPILDKRDCKVFMLRGIEQNSNKFNFKEITFKDMMDFIRITYTQDNLDIIEDDETPEIDKTKNKKSVKSLSEKYFTQKKIKLTYSQIQCTDKSLNFIPFVYQEANEDKNNRLIIYDIKNREVSSSIIINPDPISKDHININEKDSLFKSYQLCFSSDLEPCKGLNRIGVMNKERKPKNIQVKLSLATFFQESYGRIQIQEFLVRNGPQVKTVDIMGIKQIFFSKELLQIYQQSGYIKNSYIAPFHLCDETFGNENHRDHIKGIQLVWHKDKTEEDQEEEPEHACRNDGKEEGELFINLLDQDMNNQIYQYQTDIACFGQKKFMMDPHNPEIYAIAICATLKKEAIERMIFENMEVVYILTAINEITAGIKMTDLRYLMLNSFETMKQKDFFKNQEIFNGKSFCDICLKDADEIVRAIKNHDEMDQYDHLPTGSHIHKLCGGDQQRFEIMRKTGFYKEDLKIQQDYKFQGTIKKAIDNGYFQPLKILMDHILLDLNDHVYQDLIMFNLRNLLECSKIEINEFFERTVTEKKNRNDEGFCNLELSFKNIKLPEFSEKANDYMKVPKLYDQNLWIQEIEQKIKDRDTNKEDNKKSYEIEHSYIDFQHMIIGEKIRAFNETSYYEFNDFKLCKLMTPNSESLEFYKGQTIQRVISYQWQTSKIIYKFLFYTYLLTFAGPFYLSQMTETAETKANALKICLFPMAFLLIGEITQLTTYIQQKGWASLRILDFYGIIFVMLFFLYVVPELLGVFSYEAEQKRLKNELWNPNELLPELLFTLLLLSFVRLLQYIRVYEEFGFFIDMFIHCLKDLQTFIISFVAFLIFFTFCYIQLNVEAMEAVSHAQGTGFFEDMFFGTYRCGIQELSMPEYPNLSRVTPMTNAVQANIYLIWIMYMFQAFLMAVVFLNFIIGVISSTYNRVYEYKLILKFKQQASINDECFTLIDLFNTIFNRKDLFKVLVFSSTVEGNIMEEDQFEDQIDQLKKYVTKQNKDVFANHDTINKLFNEVTVNQQNLENLTSKKFDELDRNQSKISDQIIESIHKKNMGYGLGHSHTHTNPNTNPVSQRVDKRFEHQQPFLSGESPIKGVQESIVQDDHDFYEVDHPHEVPFGDENLDDDADADLEEISDGDDQRLDANTGSQIGTINQAARNSNASFNRNDTSSYYNHN